MITFLMSAWGRLLVAGVVGAIVGFGTAWKLQGVRLEAVKQEFQTFTLKVKAEGEVAERLARLKEKEDKQATEALNAKNKVLLADNASLSKRLREQRAGSGFLPKPPADTRNPETACFGRTELESALQRLDSGVSAIISEGYEAQLRLSTAAEWARSVGK